MGSYREKVELLRNVPYVLPLTILASSVCLTLILWGLFDSSLRERSQALYSDRVDEISQRLIKRMHDHEQVLRGAAGLFSVKEEVTRSDWRHYVTSLQLDEFHPGILGIGFSAWLTPQEKATNIAAVRGEGFPEYVVRPVGERPVYTSVVYLEPFNWRNQRAFGYDMYTEPVRRSAMDKARDGNFAAIAAKIILVQETDKDKQSGMLMYLPVYRQGKLLDSVAQRHEAFLGFVYSPIRMNDFVTGTLGNLPSDVAFDVRVGAPGTDNLMFSSDLANKREVTHQEHPQFTSKKTVEAYGNAWEFTFRTLPEFNTQLNTWQSSLVLCSGLLFSLLVSYLVHQMMRTRNLAIEQGEEKIASLNNRLSLAVDSGQIGVWDYMVPEQRLVWDKWMFALYGVNEEDFSGAYEAWQNGLHPDDRERGNLEIAQALKGEKEFDTVFRVIWPTGQIRYIKAAALVQRDAAGNPLRMIGVNYDITERKRTEKSLHDQAVMLEQEVGHRRQTQETLAVKQQQLQMLNETLENRVTEEVRKNREKDKILLHQDKLASIGQLAAGVAHEINNPIGFIMSNLGTLQSYAESEKQYLTALEKVAQACCSEQELVSLEELHRKLDLPFILEDIPPLIAESLEGAERVKRIVLDLKDFARTDENSLKQTDLNHCVQSTANIVRNELRYIADLNLDLQEIPLVICNPQQINQVIANILVNAAHAIDGHGRITVTTSHEQGRVLLTFTDTGRGIPPEIQGRIFDPFFTTKPVGKGTGLGLSISYDIVKKHGGEISLQSEVGVGTTFVISLPITGPTGGVGA